MLNLLLAISLLHSPARFFGVDKIKHLVLSAFIQSVTYSSLRAMRVSHRPALTGATAATAAIGAGRELYDWRVKSRFSTADLAWDAAGIGAAIIMLKRTER